MCPHKGWHAGIEGRGEEGEGRGTEERRKGRRCKREIRGEAEEMGRDALKR